MIALFLIQLASAFPPRGFLTQPPDNRSVILDRDTILIAGRTPAVQTEGCLFTTQYLHTYKTPYKLDSFPNPRPSARFSGEFDVFAWARPRGPANYCRGAFAYSPWASKFLVRGQNTWALWQDSAWFHYPPPSDPALPPPLGTDPKVRWRWSRLDGSPSWARWVDTVHLEATGRLSGSQPLLSLLAATSIDSIVPQYPGSGQVLKVRRDSLETLGSLVWSSGGGVYRSPTWTIAPMGSTLHVVTAGVDAIGTRLWRIWSGGAVRDSFWIERPAPASLRTRPVPLRSPNGSWSIDGRRRTGLPGWIPRFGIGEAGAVGGAK